MKVKPISVSPQLISKERRAIRDIGKYLKQISQPLKAE
jgi:hypothetical protein